MLLQVFSCSSEELKNRRANWRSSALVSFYQGSPPRCAKTHSAESATEADSALQKTDRVACAPLIVPVSRPSTRSDRKSPGCLLHRCGESITFVVGGLRAIYVLPTQNPGCPQSRPTSLRNQAGNLWGGLDGNLNFLG